MALICRFGDIYRANFNRIVTGGFAYDKKFKQQDVLKHAIAQSSDAIMASSIVLCLFPNSEFLGRTALTIDYFRAFVLALL